MFVTPDRAGNAPRTGRAPRDRQYPSDHDTITAFRCQNRPAFEAALPDILPMARQAGLLRVGTVSLDGTNIDANVSNIRPQTLPRELARRETIKANLYTACD